MDVCMKMCADGGILGRLTTKLHFGHKKGCTKIKDILAFTPSLLTKMS